MMVVAGAPAAAAPAAAPVVKAPAADVAAPAAAVKDAPASFRFGLDERIREEITDGISSTPSTAASKIVKNDYFRFRTRLWAEFDPMNNVTVRARIANEWRKWQDPDKAGVADCATYAFPDEFVVDTLYLQVKGFMPNGKGQIRIGRQDITDLSGRIIMDGTPEDGSRTMFFNAVRITCDTIQDTTIDLVGIYNTPKDVIPLNQVETTPKERTDGRDLTGFTGGFDEMTESGGGIYLKNKSIKDLPCEVYGFYKQESEWNDTTAATNSKGTYTVTKDWQTGDVAKKCIVNAKSDIYVAGAKVQPQLAKGLKGSAEAAYEFGERGSADLAAYMMDVGLSYVLPVSESMAPTICASWYYLSGDDPTTANKDEGWTPPWARYPQDSEILVLTVPRGKWSNLSMPTAKFVVAPCKFAKVTLAASLCTAPEASATGDEIGWLYLARADMTIKEGLLKKNDKLTALIHYEVLEPGDYFVSQDQAYFARFEVGYVY
ncbi:MAG: hypothetical protein C0404_12175 [Verrucomicrobia bacterium]|nr:hypothetical protein [Verrucomicrobiota bacterium]